MIIPDGTYWDPHVIANIGSEFDATPTHNRILVYGRASVVSIIETNTTYNSGARISQTFKKFKNASGTNYTSGLGTINNNVNNYVLTATGTAGTINGEANLQFDGTTLSVTGDVSITGSLTAASKSFDIPHPTKEGYRLRYGVLEGPEHGVYFRGKTTSNVIELPEYWSNLVDADTITVQLTPIKTPVQHYVIKVDSNKVYIDSDTNQINTYFIVHAERKDTDKVLHEYKP